jgi:hypothetical protein
MAEDAQIEQGTWGKYELVAGQVRAEVAGGAETADGPWVETGGMDAGGGILVYDAERKLAYGAHLSSPHEQEAAQLEQMLDAAFADFAGSAALRVFISGCCCAAVASMAELDDEAVYEARVEARDARLAARQRIETELARRLALHGVPALCGIHWPDDGVIMASLELDLATGECYLETTRDVLFRTLKRVHLNPPIAPAR